MSKQWMRSWLHCLLVVFVLFLCRLFLVPVPFLLCHVTAFDRFCSGLRCTCRSVFKQSLSHFVSIAHPLPWIMHKDALFITILQELLCTSISWRDYFPFSSHQLNLKKDLQPHLLTNHILIEASTPLSHCQHTTIHLLWPPTEEFHHGSS